MRMLVVDDSDLIRRAIRRTIEKPNDEIRTAGDGVEALRVADTAYVLQTGRVVLEGAAADLIGDPLVQEAFLGLGAA